MSGAKVDIACPHCHWKPDGQQHWVCQACQMEFDMFEDLGRCPRCYHSHERTTCMEDAGGCGHTAPHLDWYRGVDEKLAKINIRRSDF